ncbi:MAG: hypothetical protein QXW00_02755 [Candidatus Woesearchaeota archaeon]
MARPLSEEEIDLINSMDDENVLFTVPEGYEVFVDEKRGVIVRQRSRSHFSKVHVAG